MHPGQVFDKERIYEEVCGYDAEGDSRTITELVPVSYTHLDVYKRQELDFPSSEIFYYQQQQFTFPVSTSMNVEIVTNKKALTTVRNKKKELKDLDNHCLLYTSPSFTLPLYPKDMTF